MRPDEVSIQKPGALSWLLGAAAIFILLAGLKTVSHIVTPFLLAAFLAIISAPPMAWMQRRGVPGLVSILLLFSLVGVAFFLLFLALQGAAESLATQAPTYQAKLAGWLEQIREMLAARGAPPELLPAQIPLPVSGNSRPAPCWYCWPSCSCCSRNVPWRTRSPRPFPAVAERECARGGSCARFTATC